jgi:hypothetical protein
MAILSSAARDPHRRPKSAQCAQGLVLIPGPRRDREWSKLTSLWSPPVPRRARRISNIGKTRLTRRWPRASRPVIRRPWFAPRSGPDSAPMARRQYQGSRRAGRRRQLRHPTRRRRMEPGARRRTGIFQTCCKTWSHFSTPPRARFDRTPKVAGADHRSRAPRDGRTQTSLRRTTQGAWRSARCDDTTSRRGTSCSRPRARWPADVANARVRFPRPLARAAGPPAPCSGRISARHHQRPVNNSSAGVLWA